MKTAEKSCCAFFSCLLIMLPAAAHAGWDKTGRHHMSDSGTLEEENGYTVEVHENAKNIGQRELVMKEAIFGTAAGVSSALAFALIGYGICQSDPSLPGAVTAAGAFLGFVTGSSFGIYCTSGFYDKKGTFPIVMLSEAIALGAIIASGALIDDSMKSSNCENKRHNRLFTIGLSLSITIPTVAGIVANHLTLKDGKRN